MTTYRRFTCWQPQDVGRIVPITAESPSDAVFQATHSPAIISRTRSGTFAASELTSEQELLREFMDEDRHFTFVPVIGDAGSGKSHLIRWLASRIPSTPLRRVIVVHKYQTNLRGVIEQILNCLDESGYEEFRQKLRDSTGALDPIAARYLLIAKLQYLISSANPANHAIPKRQAYLAQTLPYFIGDPFIQAQLAADGRVVARFVSEALKGRGVEDKDAPYEFTIDDLMIEFEDIERINAAGKSLHGQLRGSPGLRDEAVGWLNQHLGAALRALYGLSGNELSSIIYALRRQLLAEGIELVLLIEDFAVLQGIQGELLDAVIADTEQQGERVLCSIRTALAVTSGYFQTLETARQRATFIVDMNVEAHQIGKEAQAYSSALVARYLNAIRIGAARLSSHWDSGGRTGTEEWVPNACSGCRYREVCFGAFGSSESDYGLYPFNEASLANFVAQVSRSRLNPRTVLRDVVLPIMSDGHQEIRTGTFPSDDLVKPFHITPMGIDDLTALGQVVESEVDRGRRKRLLSLWQHEARFRDFHPAFHEAFDLPMVRESTGAPIVGGVTPATEAPVIPPKEDPPPQPEPPAQTVPEPPKWSRLDAWAALGANLSMGDAQSFRSLVYRAVVDAIDWESLGLSRQYIEQKLIWNANGVILPGDTSQTRRPLVVLPVMREGSERLEVARVLRALDILNAGGNPAISDVVELAEELGQWCAVVESGIRGVLQGPGATDPVPALVEMMIVGASICGGTMNSDPGDAIRVMLKPPLEHRSSNSAWSAVRSNYSSVFSEIRAALLAQGAIAKGTGEPRMLDLSRVLPAVERAMDLIQPSSPLPDSRPFESLKRHSAAVFHEVPQVIEQEVVRLKAIRAGLLEAFTEDCAEASLEATLCEAAQSAVNANAFRPPGAQLRLSRAIEQITSGTATSVMRMLDGVLESRGGKQLRALAAFDVDFLEAVRADVSAIDSFLAESIQAAELALDALQRRATGGATADAVRTLARIEADLLAIKGSLQFDGEV